MLEMQTSKPKYQSNSTQSSQKYLANRPSIVDKYKQYIKCDHGTILAYLIVYWYNVDKENLFDSKFQDRTLSFGDTDLFKLRSKHQNFQQKCKLFEESIHICIAETVYNFKAETERLLQNEHNISVSILI